MMQFYVCGAIRGKYALFMNEVSNQVLENNVIYSVGGLGIIDSKSIDRLSEFNENLHEFNILLVVICSGFDNYYLAKTLTFSNINIITNFKIAQSAAYIPTKVDIYRTLRPYVNPEVKIQNIPPSNAEIVFSAYPPIPVRQVINKEHSFWFKMDKSLPADISKERKILGTYKNELNPSIWVYNTHARTFEDKTYNMTRFIGVKDLEIKLIT